ncbi:MAG TPA: zinc ribbon domain-containing protein [Casimicrobiaceae bacterium]|nr:zinc ribbon domain-containing protein [Casimicrobiaceae bacterium]
MPIYEYRCGACGHELEALQKLSEPPLSECPACRKRSLTKLISAVGFQLKGSGWYATDFKSSGKPSDKANGKSADGAAKPAEGKSDSSGDSKSGESKSDSSSESKGAPKAETASTSSGGCGGGCSCH